MYKPSALSSRVGVRLENSTTAKPKQRLPFLNQNRISIAFFGGYYWMRVMRVMASDFMVCSSLKTSSSRKSKWSKIILEIA